MRSSRHPLVRPVLPRWLLALSLAAATLSPALLRAAAPKDDDRAIQLLAQTLRRFGNGSLANRLTADYKAGRVRFGALPPGENAHVKAGKLGWGGISSNTMTLSQAIEDLGRTVRPGREYAPSSELVGYALTVVHEYVHMDQPWPDTQPKWEDPAYREVERTIVAWVDRLRGEMSALQSAPPSPQRAAKLREIDQLLGHLKSQCGGYAATIKELEASEPGRLQKLLGKRAPVSRGRSFQFDSQAKLIDNLRAQLASLLAGKPASSPAPARPGHVPAGGAWVRMESGVNWNYPPEQSEPGMKQWDATVTVMDGLQKMACKDNQGRRVRLKCTWTGIPETIRPGDVVQITVTGSDDGSESGTAGSHCVASPALWMAPAKEGPWKMHAGNFPGTGSSANAPPVTYTYRVPAPPKGAEGRAKIVVIDIGFANGFKDGAFKYVYYWKDGPSARRP